MPEVIPTEPRERRLFIFGWDAADWEVIEEGWRQGKLGHLKSIADRGSRGTLMSTTPPLTPSAWTSFLTGTDPGEHGVYNFRALRHSDHKILPTSGGTRRVPTLMHHLDANGITTCQVTVPWTYPAERLTQGVVVPGWDDPGESFETTWPADAADLLSASLTRVPRRTTFHGESGAHVRRLTADLADRASICDLLMDGFDPRVFMVVYVEPDRAGHLLWDAGPVPSSLIDVYESVDQAMGRFMERWVQPDDLVVVCSDHGTRPVHSAVQLAPILQQGGWLTIAKEQQNAPRLARRVRKSLWRHLPPRVRNRIWRNLPKDLVKKASRSARHTRTDWAKTSAFPLGTLLGVGIWINTDPPFTGGIVRPQDYEALRDAITGHLRGVVDPDDGQPVFDRVMTREEIYAGRAIDDAPDIVLVPKDGYGVSQGMGVAETVTRVAAGGHRPEGVFLTSHDIGLGTTVGIQDLLPAVLAGMGFPAPSPDGGSLGITDQPDLDISDQDIEEIEDRLRDLGYIE